MSRVWGFLWLASSVIVMTVVVVFGESVQHVGTMFTGEPVWIHQFGVAVIFPAIIAVLSVLNIIITKQIKGKHEKMFTHILNQVAFFIVGVQIVITLFAYAIVTNPIAIIGILVAWLYMMIGNLLPILDRNYSWPRRAALIKERDVRVISRKVGIVFVGAALFLLPILFVPVDYQAIYLSLVLTGSAIVKVFIVVTEQKRFIIK
ncbi:hypothetical protein [Geomicrobium sp. JCM 19039]|uniref:hypothetical protein n=1 Tax=Geomicrobium sp. JCM 19039 TaxID=1460636 RepID=UPI0005A6CDBD|nr:hypothetical protein [Geomicrobium sp. JCM 19039]